MEINLLPRKSFVEKRFFLLSFILFLLLFALGYLLWNAYLQKNYENLTLQLEVQTKKTEKTILLSNLGWNEDLKKYDVQVQNIKRYQLIVDGLQHTEIDWPRILSQVQALLPEQNDELAFTTKGNYLSGTVQLNDLQSAATFIEQLKNYDEFNEVFIELIELQTGNESLSYQIHFSVYLSLLSF